MTTSSDASSPRRGKPDRSASRAAWIGGGIVVVALAFVTWRMRSSDAEWVSPKELDARMPATDIPVQSDSLAPGSPAPGPAPPGKVWSPEHGHWHDAAPADASQPLQLTPMTPEAAGAAPATGTLTPQPEGPVPDGKVWSPEHGHWHDAAPAGSATPLEMTPVPGAAPGTLTPQPEGPAPPGKVWSAEHGHWHDAPPGG